MDYQSFQPNPPIFQQLPPVRKTFISKFVWVIVGLLVFGGVAYAGIWYWQNQQLAQEVVPTFTPRPDETAGWKTYTNTQYGFGFKYPSNWTYTGTSPNYFDQIDPATGKIQISEGTGIFNFSILDGDLNTEYVKVRDECKAFGPAFNVPDPIFSYHEIIFAGKNSWQVNCNSEYGAPYTNTLLSIGTKTIKIQSASGFDLHNQILSTFKFVDSADTSTWKTFVIPN